MSLEEREHFKTLFHGTVIMVEDLCRNESYQAEYLKYAPCMKKVEKQNEMCLKTYTKAMKEIESRTEEQTTSEPDLVTYQKRKRETADEGIRSVCWWVGDYMTVAWLKINIKFRISKFTLASRHADFITRIFYVSYKNPENGTVQ